MEKVQEGKGGKRTSVLEGEGWRQARVLQGPPLAAWSRALVLIWAQPQAPGACSGRTDRTDREHAFKM